MGLGERGGTCFDIKVGFTRVAVNFAKSLTDRLRLNLKQTNKQG